MLSFNSIHNRNEIYLYAGDLSDELLMQGKQNKFVGLSIEKEDDHHISEVWYSNAVLLYFILLSGLGYVIIAIPYQCTDLA